MNNIKFLGISGLLIFWSMIAIIAYAIVYIGRSGIDIVLTQLANL